MGEMAAPISTDGFHRPSLELQDPESTFGSILDLVDFNAEQNPEHTFAIQLSKNLHTGSSEQLSMNFRDFKSTILACCKHVREAVLQATADGSSPIALLMASDVCLIVYMFALMHLQVPVLLLSARLSSSAIEHLLRATQTFRIIASSNLRERAKEAVAGRIPSELVAVHEQEPLDVLMSSGEMSMPAHTSLAAHAANKPLKHCLILHSSGTTGMPKPIYHTERYLLAFTTCHDLDVTPSGPCLSTLPLFHGYGLLPSCLALSIGMTVCLPPRAEIPHAPALLEHLRRVDAGSFISVPSILEDMAASNGIQVLRHLAFVAFGGGKLKDSAGETLVSNGVRLLNHYGATETGPLAPIFVPGDEYDWRYFRLRTDAGIELRPTSINDDGRQKFRLSIQPPGWDRIFQIQDELVRAPLSTHQDYAAVGRTDDVLVLANGEKVRPGVLEAEITEHADVKSAVVFGNDQVEVGLLLQPAQAIALDSYDSFVDSVWPEVEKANRLMDAHAQVSSKQCILVIPHDAVLPRSDKGSILRREVYASFATDISDLYAKLSSVTSKDFAEQLHWDRLEDEISGLIHKHCHLPSRQGKITSDEDLFSRGLDSLQAVQLRRRLQASLASSQEMAIKAEALPRDFVYRFPSIQKIANALRGVEAHEPEVLFDRSELDNLVARYSVSIERHAALVTGASGSLGSHIVEHLAKSPMISAVFCLVRPTLDADPKDKMLKALSSRGLHLDELARSKLCVLEGNLSEENLGLIAKDYQRILTSVKWVMHAGWPMDFKLTLTSFAPAFRALQDLLSLVAEISRSDKASKPKFVFISSISTVAYYPDLTNETIVPEVAMPTPSCALDIGYAKAKLVCEAIIERAAKECPKVAFQYIRMGQLCGSSKTGLWNEEEHMPALLKSSLVMGGLPEIPGTLSWIPVDKAAEVVCDILLDSTSTRTVFHVEAPIRQSWADMSCSLRRHLGLQNMTSLPYEQWLTMLSKAPFSESPAAKLLPFFEMHFKRMACGRVSLDTIASRDISPALRRVGGVSDVDVGRYIAQWRKVGFLKGS